MTKAVFLISVAILNISIGYIFPSQISSINFIVGGALIGILFRDNIDM